jgi:uncharacterized protein (TIRG00374 family)
MSRKLAGLLIGLGISALAFWWALPPDGLHSLPGYLASARVGTLALAVLAATLTFPLRAIRWRVLLRAEAGDRVPMGAVWHATAIGFMANNILPFRLGEVIRAYAVGRLGGPRFPAAVASVAVERVFDALTVVGLFAVVLTGQGLPSDIMIGSTPAADFVRVIGIAGLAALIVGAGAAFFPDAAERLLRKVVPLPGLADRLATPLRSFAHGLQVLHDPKRIALFALGSVALWTVNAWSFGLALRAFGLPSDLGTAILVQTCVVFAVAAPSTPGYVGVFEGGFKAAALLVGLNQTAVFAAAATYHVLSYIPITLLGVWSLSTTGLKLGELRTDSPPPERAGATAP